MSAQPTPLPWHEPALAELANRFDANRLAHALLLPYSVPYAVTAQCELVSLLCSFAVFACCFFREGLAATSENPAAAKETDGVAIAMSSRGARGVPASVGVFEVWPSRRLGILSDLHGRSVSEAQTSRLTR